MSRRDGLLSNSGSLVDVEKAEKGDGCSYDSVKYRVMKPLCVVFESVADRQHFVRLFCNYKRMYHESRIRNELLYEYRHDQKKGYVTWLAAEVEMGEGVKCRLRFEACIHAN